MLHQKTDLQIMQNKVEFSDEPCNMLNIIREDVQQSINRNFTTKTVINKSMNIVINKRSIS